MRPGDSDGAHWTAGPGPAQAAQARRPAGAEAAAEPAAAAVGASAWAPASAWVVVRAGEGVPAAEAGMAGVAAVAWWGSGWAEAVEAVWGRDRAVAGASRAR